MSTLLDNFRLVFTFCFDMLGSFATFFTTNTLGQLILAITFFSIITYLVIYIVTKIH